MHELIFHLSEAAANAGRYKIQSNNLLSLFIEGKRRKHNEIRQIKAKKPKHHSLGRNALCYVAMRSLIDDNRYYSILFCYLGWQQT